MDKGKINIELTENGLSEFMQHIVDELYEDLEEVQENINVYKDIIKTAKDGGDQVKTLDLLTLYGPGFNDSLKIKSSIRDKFLKLVTVVKDKTVKTEGDKGIGFSATDIASLAKHMEKLEKEGSNE